MMKVAVVVAALISSALAAGYGTIKDHPVTFDRLDDGYPNPEKLVSIENFGVGVAVPHRETKFSPVRYVHHSGGNPHGGNSHAVNNGGNGGYSNQGGNSHAVNNGGNGGYSNQGGNSHAVSNGGNGGYSNQGGNTHAVNNGGNGGYSNQGGNTHAVNNGGNGGYSNQGGNTHAVNNGGNGGYSNQGAFPFSGNKAGFNQFNFGNAPSSGGNVGFANQGTTFSRDPHGFFPARQGKGFDGSLHRVSKPTLPTTGHDIKTENIHIGVPLPSNPVHSPLKGFPVHPPIKRIPIRKIDLGAHATDFTTSKGGYGVDTQQGYAQKDFVVHKTPLQFPTVAIETKDSFKGDNFFNGKIPQLGNPHVQSNGYGDNSGNVGGNQGGYS